MVQYDSAELAGYNYITLAKDHWGLINFSGADDIMYKSFIRGPIQRMVVAAPALAKERFTTVRGQFLDDVKDVKSGLGLLYYPSRMYDDMKKDTQQSDPTWVLKEKECATWLEVSRNSPSTSCLWIKGPPGREKPTAVVSIIDKIKSTSAVNSNPLCAYYNCGAYEDTADPEGMLRSFLHQLVDQQESLYHHAEQFVSLNGRRATQDFTVENLWLSLMNMLSDLLVDKVYLIVHDLHELPDASGSTRKFLELLHAEISTPDGHDSSKRHGKVRWLFTSRNSYSVNQALSNPRTLTIDLDDKKRYSTLVGAKLKQYANQQAEKLAKERKYNLAMVYLASSVMSDRAPNTTWVDLACLVMEQLPLGTREIKIKRELGRLPEDLDKLFHLAWSRVLKPDDEDFPEMLELLRTLILVKEPVTKEELLVLTGLEADETTTLLAKCAPLVTAHAGQKFGFACGAASRDYLIKNSRQLLEIGEVELKWQHGSISLRCYDYLLQAFHHPAEAKGKVNHQNNNKVQLLPYAIKYWLYHASQATADLAQMISAKDELWAHDSPLRENWLRAYGTVTKDKRMEALSVSKRYTDGSDIAAELGYSDLATALKARGRGQNGNMKAHVNSAGAPKMTLPSMPLRA